MAVAVAQPFVGGEFFKAHGAAGSDFVGADADFGAHAEFAAVSEARGGVPIDGGGIDFGQEFFGGGFVAGDDAIRVGGAVSIDVANGGSDEGKPGFRPPEATSGFYATYLRDPTGNKICVFAVS